MESASAGGSLPPLLLAPLLTDLHAWLSSPTLGGSTALPASPANPTGTASAAIRASSALFNLLPASRGSTPPPPSVDEGDGARSSTAGGSAGADSDSSKKKKVKCRCVEAYGNNLYIGTSDGQVLWYTYDAAGLEPYTLRHRHNIFPRRPITSLHLLPSIQKALILSETTLHFVSLPTLEPVPSGLIQAVRGVVAVAVDEGPEGVEGERNVCVIKRKGIGIYRLSTRLFHVKDVPLPEVPVIAKYHHPYLCISDMDTYSLVSLLEATLSPVLPVSQLADPSDLPYRVRPNIAVVQEDEFLITSCVNANGIGGTIGVFMSGEGDPVRGSIEWEENPRDLVVQPPYIIALLRSGSIQVHSLLTLEPIQLIPPPSGIDPRHLSLSPTGFAVPARERDAQLRKVVVPLLPAPPQAEKVDGTAAQLGGFEEPSGSGLTPPSSPAPGRPSFNSSGSSNRSLPPSGATQLSQVLLLSSSSVRSLTTTPALTLALEILELAPSSPSLLADALGPLMLSAATNGEQDDGAVRFVHQKVFLRGLREARFGGFGEAAQGEPSSPGKGGSQGPKLAELWALAGGDYRLVLRLFGEMRALLAALRPEDDEKPLVEEGLAHEWEALLDVEEIIRDNLERDPTPSAEAPAEPSLSPAHDRHDSLLRQAREMLRSVLQSEHDARLRTEKGKGREWVRSAQEETNGKIIDTALLVLLSRIGSTADILHVMDAPHLAEVALVQEALREHERWFALAQSSPEAEAIELYADMVKGTKTDPDCPTPPLTSILQIISRTSSTALVRTYGSWLASLPGVESSAVWAAIGGDAFGSRGREEEVRRGLLMELVRTRVKLVKEPATAAQLLNDHSMHLDLVEVLEHIPDDWQLRSIEPFLARALRKDLQRREEGQILKAVAASLNLRTMDRALETFARFSPVVQDGPPPPSPSADGEKAGGGEGDGEKAGVPGGVHEVVLGPARLKVERSAAAPAGGAGQGADGVL